jgi:hypothetical protein
MSKQLIVIDRKVANYQSVIDQLDASYCYLLLDAESDGVAQITGYVNEQSGFDVIRLSSHGSPLASRCESSFLLPHGGSTPRRVRSYADHDASRVIKKSSGNSAPFRRMTEHRLRQAERTKNSLI